MPESALLSSGAGLGLLAAVVSGVCFVVANRISWTSRGADKRRVSPRACACRDRGELRDYWHCRCDDEDPPLKFRGGAWALRQLGRAVGAMSRCVSADRLEQIAEESDGPAPEEAGRVREFLESLCASLSGGALERVPAAPLYRHPDYLSMFARHHARLRACLTALANALRDALARKTSFIA